MDIMIQQVELQIPNMLKRGGHAHFWNTVLWGLKVAGMCEIETQMYRHVYVLSADASRTSTTEETSDGPSPMLDIQSTT